MNIGSIKQEFESFNNILKKCDMLSAYLYKIISKIFVIELNNQAFLGRSKLVG